MGMDQTSVANSGTQRAVALGLLVATVALQVMHLLVVTLVPHPLLLSNDIQLLFPFLVMGACLQQRAATTNPAARLRWMAIASAFVLWALAQLIFLLLIHFPSQKIADLHLDDAFWMLFGLPMILVIYSTGEGKRDSVGMLDRIQAMAFFAVLYLLIFLPSVRLKFATAYNIQDAALLLCCLLRLPVCTSTPERRFYARLGLFLLVYSPLTWLSYTLYARGWAAGSMVDLGWTLPMTAYIAFMLYDTVWPQAEQPQSRLILAARHMQGLGVTTLAFLSLGVSGLLAVHRPVLGGAFAVGVFALFALRTNARERAWDHAHGRLEETVLQDALTGLGNRILLRNQLTERLSQTRPGRSAVLLFADLDRFKSINDSLGHALGDRLLIEVGTRLAAAAPSDSVVCRLGGDEFVVLASSTNPTSAQHTGEHLLHALRAPFHLGNHEVRCTASIGVVLASPGESADDLLRTADHAMYRAKQLGKNRVQLFDATLRAQLSSRWRMEAELRACVEQDGIEVAFQPIFSLQEGSICGFEALARWTHPERGAVPPSEFIPLAEETGLVVALGAQVLEKACRQMVEWNRSWGTELSVSVNVSPRQIADAGLLTVVLDTLARTGLHPTLLRLEITESALLVHEGTVKHTLAQARSHGIGVSLDDFGTGYSSLSFLLKLPVDEVKVDRSFVSDMQSDPDREELVRTVIHLGLSLGKRVVAEGVETEAELRKLIAMGCECVQGWLISRPLPPAELELELPALEARIRQFESHAHVEAPEFSTAETEQAIPARPPHQFPVLDQIRLAAIALEIAT